MTAMIHVCLRLFLVIATPVLLVAVGLGHWTSMSELEPRRLHQSELRGTGAYPWFPNRHQLWLLDTQNAAMQSLSLPKSETIDFSAVSPWQDGWGQHQIVGRWQQWSNQDHDLLRNVGLARVQYPSGRIIDRVALDSVPISPPCWVSQTSARVLFVSGHGKLHRYDFDDPSEGVLSSRHPTKAEPVDWAVDPPGDGQPMIFDVERPQGLTSGQIVLVAMSTRVQPAPNVQPRYKPSEIWWLRLDEQDRTICEYGRVTTTDPTGIDVNRRRPVMVRGRSGQFWLAYISQGFEKDRQLLRVLPVTIAPKTGAPTAEASTGRVLSDDLLPMRPGFSADGQHVLALTGSCNAPQVLRVPIEPEPTTTLVHQSEDFGQNRNGGKPPIHSTPERLPIGNPNAFTGFAVPNSDRQTR